MLRCSPENLCKFLYHFVHKSNAIFKLIQGNRWLLFFCFFSQVKCKRSKNVLEHAVPVVECLLIVSMVSGRSSVLSEDETAVRKFGHKHTVLSLYSSLTTCVCFIGFISSFANVSVFRGGELAWNAAVKGNVSGISWSILHREVENVLLLMWKKLEVVQILAQRTFWETHTPDSLWEKPQSPKLQSFFLKQSRNKVQH